MARVRELAEGRTPWALPRPCIHEFYSVSRIARIAALCVASGTRELWSADRYFSRFPALRPTNPLL